MKEKGKCQQEIFFINFDVGNTSNNYEPCWGKQCARDGPEVKTSAGRKGEACKEPFEGLEGQEVSKNHQERNV